MSSLVVDTHAAIWYLHMDPRFSRNAETALDHAFASGDPVYLPSICLIELTYLVEKGRVPRDALVRLRQLLGEPSLGLRLAYLDLPVADALEWIPRDEVPDLPDRVIAATAFALNLPLVSRDRRIQSTSLQTIW
jgi:PIN domain nuclease of toxin-antitoxin system